MLGNTFNNSYFILYIFLAQILIYFVMPFSRNTKGLIFLFEKVHTAATNRKNINSKLNQFIYYKTNIERGWEA